MATCSSLINRALRKLGRLGAGRDARTNDAQDALDVLRGLYTSWIASGALGRLQDVIAKGDLTAYENMRVIRPTDVTAEITLPDFVPKYANRCLPYGALWPYTLDNRQWDARPPRDGAVIAVIDQATGTEQTWIYDGTLKLWASINDLTINDNAPLSSADPDGLSAVLAVQIADQFGADVSPITVAAANRYQQQLTHRYSMPRTEAVGVYF